jgi:hypothetical protein
MMAPIVEDNAASATLRSVSGVVDETLLTPSDVAEILGTYIFNSLTVYFPRYSRYIPLVRL